MKKHKFKLSKFKKPRTSKIIMWLFIALLIYVVIEGVNYDFPSTTMIDASIFCACVVAVSGITGAIITKYYNNSNAENIPKIQLELYEKSMKIRLKYNEEMMKLKKQYEMTSDDVNEIESESNMDEVTDGILDSAISELDEKSSKSHEDVEISG